MRRFYRGAITFGFLVGMFWGGSSSRVIGQEKTEEKNVGPFSGTVVDTAGKPVAGATVWLVGGTDFDPQAVGETTSDEQGRFRFPERTWSMVGDRAMSPTLTARDKQGRIGGQVRDDPIRSTADIPPKPSKPFENIKVKLQEVKDCQGRLVDDSDRPIAKAKVRPLEWTWEQRGERFVQELIFLPSNLANEMAVETDADGRFTLHHIPAQGRIVVKILADGFGEPCALWKTADTTTFKLGRAGRVRGAVTCPQDKQAVADIKLSLEKYPRQLLDVDTLLFYFGESRTPKDGIFQFEKVPPGKYVVRAELPEASCYYYESRDPIEVRPEETATVEVKLKPAIKVQGKVVDQETKEGVAGIRVSLYFNDDRGPAPNPTTTDAQGSFVLYTRPGKANLQIWQVPEQYTGPTYPRQVQNLEISREIVLPPIELQKGLTLECQVVDKAGKPVPDAEIYYRSLEMGSPSLPDRNQRTDQSGKFTLKKLSSKDTLNLRARTKKAAAEPINVQVAQAKGPVRMVVDEGTSFALRGVVVDESGKPVAEAEVSLVINLWFGNWGTSYSAETSKTDAEGKFEFGGLWAGDKYDIGIKSNGFEKYGSRKIEGTAGKAHDFGKITLARADGFLEGTVTDSSGVPLAGVRMFNSGDASEPIETRTESAGRFRLERLRNGPVYVFAEKDGYRFATLRLNTGTADGTVKMLRKDEPVPPRTVVEAPPAWEKQKQLAIQLFEKLLADGDPDQKNWTLTSLAKLDAERAKKWGKKTGSKVNTPKAQPNLKKIAEDDLDEALSMLVKEGPRSYYRLKELADHFAAKDPVKALRCIEEAVIQARSLDQPERALCIAQSGVLAIRLGSPESGKKLIEEAADMASSWKGSQQRSYYLGRLTLLVAVCDAPRAIAMLEGIGDANERTRWKANLAVKMDDLDKAQELLRSLDPWYQSRAMLRLAYRIAPARPADALRLVENFPHQSGRDDLEKAMAYGWLATAIAPRDQKQACDLIDRAFDLLLHPADRSRSSYDNLAQKGAVLAVQAQEIHYSDMESAIHRAIALRPTAQYDSNPVRVHEYNVLLAQYLALIDPGIAREIMHSVEPYADSIGSGYSGVGRDEWLKTWALIDSQRTLALADEELKAAKDKTAKERAHRSIMAAAELLSLPAGKRLESLVKRSGQLSYPNEED